MVSGPGAGSDAWLSRMMLLATAASFPVAVVLSGVRLGRRLKGARFPPASSALGVWPVIRC